MKGELFTKLKRRLSLPPKIRPRDLLWVVIPALLWLGSVYLRPFIIRPHCAATPELCAVSTLPVIDQLAVRYESGPADGFSYLTQNLTGALAILTPLLWQLGRIIFRAAAPAGALLIAGQDLILYLQTWMWNGWFTELMRLISQRARPFVYADPARRADFSNYTSFLSGHTSFVAAAGLAWVIALLSRGAPRWVVRGSLIVWLGLLISTGALRVLAGRHFPTDVLASALSGTLIALVIALTHRRT